MRFIPAVLATLILLAAGPASAGGTLSATAFGPIPAGAVITVIALDNSDENLLLQKRFESALRARGFVVAPDAPLILSFEPRDILGRWNTGERRSFIELQGGGGRTGGEDTNIRLNLFASDRGGVFNKGPDAPDVVPSKYQIDVTVERRRGPRLWQGQATADLERMDGFSLTKSMVPVVIGRLGETVRNQSFDIP